MERFLRWWMWFITIATLALGLVFMSRMSKAGEPGPDFEDAYVQEFLQHAGPDPLLVPAEPSQPIPIKLQISCCPELPEPTLFFQLHGGPGQNATAGGQITMRPAFSHGLRFGAGVDYVAGEDTSASQQANASCSSGDGRASSGWPKPPVVECEVSAASRAEKGGGTLAQALGEFQFETDWLADPVLGVGVGVHDAELAWSVTGGFLIPIWQGVSVGMSYRLIDTRVWQSASHGALVVVRVGR